MYGIFTDKSKSESERAECARRALLFFILHVLEERVARIMEEGVGGLSKITVKVIGVEKRFQVE